MSTAYIWHNYGKPPIGARTDIEGVPIDRLQAFYRNYYQPDNAVLLVAGKFDEAATLTLVQQYFGGIPRPTRTLPEMHTVEPTQDGERRVVLRREGDVQMAAAGYHVPSGVHEDFAALQILGQILADAPAGRLHKALVGTGRGGGGVSCRHSMLAGTRACSGFGGAGAHRAIRSTRASRSARGASWKSRPPNP